MKTSTQLYRPFSCFKGQKAVKKKAPRSKRRRPPLGCKKYRFLMWIKELILKLNPQNNQQWTAWGNFSWSAIRRLRRLLEQQWCSRGREGLLGSETPCCQELSAVTNARMSAHCHAVLACLLTTRLKYIVWLLHFRDERYWLCRWFCISDQFSETDRCRLWSYGKEFQLEYTSDESHECSSSPDYSESTPLLSLTRLVDWNRTIALAVPLKVPAFFLLGFELEQRLCIHRNFESQIPWRIISTHLNEADQ